jgi:hypothetical protein
MTDLASVKHKIFEIISSLINNPSITVESDTALIGDGSVMDSMKLVELCLALEDLSTDMGFSFDWTSDVAMSKSRSIFRSAGSISEEFFTQKNNQNGAAA